MSSNDHLSSPLELVIEVTNRCNLSCKYCYGDECVYNKRKQDISLEVFKKIIDEANDLDIFDICINGGECFLRNNIFKMFDYMIHKNVDFAIVTNGTLLDKKKIGFLHDRNLISDIQISVDSHIPEIHDKVRGMHKETAKAIDLICDNYDERPNIGSVIHKQNYKTFSETLKHYSLKCNNFHLMNIQASKKAMENKEFLYINYNNLASFWKNIEEVGKKLSVKLDIYENDLKPLETSRFTGCTAGKTKLIVKPNLDVIPCDITRDIILGNLKSQTLKEIWNSDKRKEIGNSRIEPCYELNKKWYLEQPIEVRGF